MTYEEVVNIANQLDEETKEKIEEEVAERLVILAKGNLDEQDMAKMEECLYMSFVIQEYLDGEYELLEEEKAILLDEMEELYNEYGELLTRAKLEEKLSRKKRMTLELMRIREQLFGRKDILKNVDNNIKTNKANNDKLKELSSKDKMKEVAKDYKKELPNPDKQKWGLDYDTKVSPAKNQKVETKPIKNDNVNNTIKNEYKVNSEHNKHVEKKETKLTQLIKEVGNTAQDIQVVSKKTNPSLENQVDKAADLARML